MLRVRQIPLDSYDAELVGLVDEYEKYNEDGWPLCPACGSVELDNHHTYTLCNQEHLVRLFLMSGLKCDRCGWESVNYSTDRFSRVMEERRALRFGAE